MERSNSCFQQHPVLRLLLPLILGILIADAWPTEVVPRQEWIVGATLCVFLLLVLSLRRFRGTFAFLLGLVFVGVGMLLAARSLQEAVFPYTYDYGTYRVSILEEPEEKPKSILCKSSLQDRVDSVQAGLKGKIFLIYLAKDSMAAGLHKGDELLVYARLAPAERNGDFDYPRYLRRKGVCGTAYVPAQRWKKVGEGMSSTFIDRLSSVRERLKARYAELGFQGDELAVITALTVGERDALSDDIREIYSISGASHTLALSGLHIGLLYAVLWFLLAPLWRTSKKLRFPCVMVVILLLWGFAALTGFPASVVRSVIMFSLIGLSTLRDERPHTLNTLATAAFLMLLFRPMWLFEVGFQLSFVAVAAIVWLHPMISDRLPVSNRALRWVRDLLSVSVAAQVGVAPLLAFYFHRFSVFFLFTNLWVIPMVSLVMYVAVLLLVLMPFPVLSQWVAWGEIHLIRLQNTVLENISQWPHASIDNIQIDVIEVLGCYEVVWLFVRFFHRHTASRTMWALGGLFGLLTYHLVKIQLLS